MKQEKNKKESNAWGITSFVVGILSVLGFLMPYFALPLAIFGLVAYGIQKQKTGFATAGLILSIIGVLINVVTGLFVIAILSMS